MAGTEIVMMLRKNDGVPGSPPPSLDEWLSKLPTEVRQSAHTFIDAEAYQLYLERGGGVSTEQQQTEDKLAAERSFFKRYGPKP